MSASVDSSPRVVAAFAASRHGVVARSQLRSLGLSDEKVDRWRRAGRLHPLFRGVYFYGPANPPAISWAAAALLACGPTAVLSHLSAAALHGLTGWPDEVNVTVPDRRCRPREGLQAHATSLGQEEIRTREGLRVTTPARTLKDLSSFLDQPTLERITNEAEVRRLVPKRHGAMPSRNDAERRLHRLLDEAGLRPDATNATVAGWEVDAVWYERRLVVELDGYQFHGTRAAFERDRRKDAALLAAGYRPLRVTWRRLTDEPLRVAAELGATLRA